MADQKGRPARGRAAFTTLRVVQEMGKTRATIQCQCGASKTCYLWAWSGHGYTICKSCKHELFYDEFINHVSKPKTTRAERVILARYGK